MARIRTNKNGVPYLYDTVTGKMERLDGKPDEPTKPIQNKQPQRLSNTEFDSRQDKRPVQPKSQSTPTNVTTPKPEVTSAKTNLPNEKISNTITKDDDIVTMCKKSLDSLVMRPDVAARCIVGEIRAIYFKSVTKPSGYDLEVFCYLDKILFDNLSSIVECIICYGSKSSDIELVKKVIKNALDVVELRCDIDGVNKVIEKVFEVF